MLNTTISYYQQGVILGTHALNRGLVPVANAPMDYMYACVDDSAYTPEMAYADYLNDVVWDLEDIPEFDQYKDEMEWPQLSEFNKGLKAAANRWCARRWWRDCENI